MPQFILGAVALLTLLVLPACESNTTLTLDASNTNPDADIATDAGADTSDAGTSDADTGPPSFAELVGVYEIATWTLNEANCDGEGPSNIAGQGDTHAALSTRTVLANEYFRSKGCTGLEDCRAVAAGSSFASSNRGVTHLWSGPPGEGSWFTSGSAAQGVDGQPCDFTVWLNKMTPSPGGLRFQNTTHQVSEIPRDSEGSCDHDAAAIAAQTSPSCTNYEIITATFVADI